jgi:S-adenosylmethionine/arginine decarboxylase-like enzyme
MFDREVRRSTFLHMTSTPLTNIAPEIFRKRLLFEGYYTINVTARTLRAYFSTITTDLGLQTYAEPIVHSTRGEGKEINQGFDGFVPLVDSGIYISVWVNTKFLSTIIYTCGEFNEQRAVQVVRQFFQVSDFQAAIF